MAEESEVTRLRCRVVELERELAALSTSTSGLGADVVKRSKINKMSSEVVDSNPYRYFSHSLK